MTNTSATTSDVGALLRGACRRSTGRLGLPPKYGAADVAGSMGQTSEASPFDVGGRVLTPAQSMMDMRLVGLVDDS